MDNDVAAGSTATIAGGDSLSLVVFPLTAAGGGRPGKVSYGLLFVALLLLAVAAFAGSGGLAEAGGWFGVVAGVLVWYGATAATAHWPTALPRRAAGRGVTAAGQRSGPGRGCPGAVNGPPVSGATRGVRSRSGPLRAGSYSTVTDLARLRGLSMSRPRARAVW